MVRSLVSTLIASCILTARGFSSLEISTRTQPNVVDVCVPLHVEVEESPVGLASQGLPPVIQSIADERREFQMNLGKAMDTIRKDMPEILRRKPDFSIYHDDITVVDPSGVTVQGLDNYKSSIKFLQTFIMFWFKERSGLQFRMVYDFCRSSIKVSWNAVLLPKVPLGKPIYLDGISVYKLDPASGKIVEHKIENLIINNTPVVPPYGVVSMMQQDLLGLQGTPVGRGIPAGI